MQNLKQNKLFLFASVLLDFLFHLQLFAYNNPMKICRKFRYILRQTKLIWWNTSLSCILMQEAKIRQKVDTLISNKNSCTNDLNIITLNSIVLEMVSWFENLKLGLHFYTFGSISGNIETLNIIYEKVLKQYQLLVITDTSCKFYIRLCKS